MKSQSTDFRAQHGQGGAVDILFEDADLLFVDKPAGMIVHPAPGHETGALTQALVAHLLDNGVLANYMQCHYAPDACRNYTFIGDAGRIENIDERRIAIYTTRCGFGDPDTIIRMPPTVGGHGGADPDIVASFVTFAKGEGSIPSNSPIAARNSVAAGVLGSYSIRNGNVPMDVPPPDPDLVKYFNNGQKKASVRKSSKK